MLYFHSFQHRRPATERNDRYMPAYYNEDAKKWYCKFYYKDWQGNHKQKKKSGFKLKRDAQEWENNFLSAHEKSCTGMDVNKVSELYFENCTFKEMKQLIIKDGKLIKELPTLEEIRQYVKDQLANEIWPEEQRFENPHRHYLDMSPSYYQLKLDLLNRIYRKK